MIFGAGVRQIYNDHILKYKANFNISVIMWVHNEQHKCPLSYFSNYSAKTTVTYFQCFLHKSEKKINAVLLSMIIHNNRKSHGSDNIKWCIINHLC